MVPYYLPFPEFDKNAKFQPGSKISKDKTYCGKRKDAFKTFAFLTEEESPCCWMDEVKKHLDDDVSLWPWLRKFWDPIGLCLEKSRRIPSAF